MLFVGLGSVGEVELTVAVFWSVPFVVGLTVIVTVAEAFLASVPMSQLTLVFAVRLQLPCVVVEEL